VKQIEDIRRALLDPGHRPDYHWYQLRRLRKEWPVLYRALMAMLTQEERSRLERQLLV